MRIRVDYPLKKPLMPQLLVKIKGCGHMPITLWYENVPHLRFSYGRIGHAAMNCNEVTPEDQGVSNGGRVASVTTLRTLLYAHWMQK
jgi:hypothetical protein